MPPPRTLASCACERGAFAIIDQRKRPGAAAHRGFSMQIQMRLEDLTLKKA